MPTLDDIKQTLRAEMPYLRERYGVDRLGICGSFVRGEQTDTSDVDLLVTFSETPDLLEFVNLKRYLEGVLERDVLIHEYFAVHLETVWDAIHERFPPIKTRLRRVLDELPPDA